MANLYETLLIVTPEAEDEGVNAVIGDLRTQVENAGGQVLQAKVWDRRKLAYPVRHKTEGTFVLMHTEGPLDLARSMKERMRLDESVIRYLVVRLEDAQEAEVREQVAELAAEQQRAAGEQLAAAERRAAAAAEAAARPVAETEAIADESGEGADEGVPADGGAPAEVVEDESAPDEVAVAEESPASEQVPGAGEAPEAGEVPEAKEAQVAGDVPDTDAMPTEEPPVEEASDQDEEGSDRDRES